MHGAPARTKKLDGDGDWLRERFIRHPALPRGLELPGPHCRARTTEGSGSDAWSCTQSRVYRIRRTVPRVCSREHCKSPARDLGRGGVAGCPSTPSPVRFRGRLTSGRRVMVGRPRHRNGTATSRPAQGMSLDQILVRPRRGGRHGTILVPTRSAPHRRAGRRHRPFCTGRPERSAGAGPLPRLTRRARCDALRRRDNQEGLCCDQPRQVAYPQGAPWARRRGSQRPADVEPARPLGGRRPKPNKAAGGNQRPSIVLLETSSARLGLRLAFGGNPLDVLLCRNALGLDIRGAIDEGDDCDRALRFEPNGFSERHGVG